MFIYTDVKTTIGVGCVEVGWLLFVGLVGRYVVCCVVWLVALVVLVSNKSRNDKLAYCIS